MSGQTVVELARHAFVKQNLHLSWPTSSDLAVSESGNCGFPSHSGKVVQELVQRLATLQVIEQSLEWDPRSSEHGAASENLLILDDDAERCVG